MKDLIGKWKGMKEETRRFLKFLAIPLVAVILIMTVVVLDKTGQTGKEPETVSAKAEGSPSESTSGQPQKVKVALQKDAVPEVNDLMKSYFNARKSCDKDALSQVYGGNTGEESLDQLLSRMEEEVKFYQSFDNLVCFTTPGIADGDYVVYVRFDIKFRQAETMAPSLIVCYAKTAPDGSCYLAADNSSEESEFMEEVNHSEEVQKMAKEVNEGLEKALKSDENLLAVYNALKNGEEAPEAAAETTGESASEPSGESASDSNNM
ncbi:hypothetical protein [Lacrimispora amygdalina]|uniref:hypothetical protein n=1 Tax=Lacrimispora amygdalina TaxID=253257 RepID=UPI000BE3CDEE|nr:hypothetical protein [Lacrimispora amygdalina]